MKPKIAITSPTRGGGPAYFFTRLQVFIAGGQAIRLHPNLDWGDVEFDALILSGGADISPSKYDANQDQENSDTVADSSETTSWLISMATAFIAYILRRLLSYESSRGRVDLERDHMEMALLQKAKNQGKPVLGICRGMQLINIFSGGSLNRNLESFYTETPQLRTILPRKKVFVEKGSLLRKVSGYEELTVNSLHDQAIKDLGRNLQVVAREKSGIIQAIESQSSQFLCLGVQWHPEFLVPMKSQRRLFRWIVKNSSAAEPADEKIFSKGASKVHQQ